MPILLLNNHIRVRQSSQVTTAIKDSETLSLESLNNPADNPVKVLCAF